MTKKKTNLALWTVVCLVSILAVGVVAYSFSGTATTVIENAGGVTINNPVEQVVTDQPFGAVASADALPSMVCSADSCVWSLTADLTDASTTIVSIPDPWLAATTTDPNETLVTGTTASGLTGATTTVDLIRVLITTAATSSIGVECGAASAAVASTDITEYTTQNPVAYHLLATGSGVSVATTTTGLLENNLTAARGAAVDGGTVPKIALGPKFPFFVCTASTTSATTVGALTDTGNQFAGKFTIRMSRPR